MSQDTAIEGVVVRSGNKTGVHGIRVEAWSKRSGVETFVGDVLTDPDGGFRLPIGTRHAGDVVHIRAIDRAGNYVYTAPRGRRMTAGRTVPIKIALGKEVLLTHDARPTSFGLEEVPFLDRTEIEGDISAAVGLISPEGTALHTNMSRVALCPGPDFELFENLVRLAPPVLRGDVIAKRQFEEALEVLVSSGGHYHDIADVAEPAAPKSQGEAAPVGAPIVSSEQAVPVMMASSLVGGPEQLGFVLGGLCEFERTGWLWRQSLVALDSEFGGSRMRGILGPLGGECGPDDGPPREFPPRCRPPVDKYQRCLEDIRSAPVTPPTYNITAITPDMACEGTLVTISGNGFGAVPGTVRFRNGSLNIQEAADTWTDTSITVRVPPNVTCDLDLEIQWKTIRVCDRYITLYRRPGIIANFDGSNVTIMRFGVNYQTSDEITCVETADEIAVRWSTCGTTSVQVEIIDEAGSALADMSSVDLTGVLRYTPSAGSRTRKFKARIRAAGPCSADVVLEKDIWVVRRPNLSVNGIEVNQSIQYFGSAQHLTDSADRGPDNSMQLVAAKTTVVRVYLRSGQDPSWDSGELGGVTGTLRVERWTGTEWLTIADLPPLGGPVTAEANPPYAIERGDLTASLNFVLNPPLVTGRLRLSVDCTSTEAPCGGGSASSSTVVDVDLAQQLTVAGISVGYNGLDAGGNDLILAAPTLTNLQNTAPQTLAMFPVADTATFRMAGTLTQTLPLTDALGGSGSGCSVRWDAFMAQVRQVVTADGNKAGTVYYGIMANGIPMGPVVGCGGNGLGTGPVGAQGTMAHEVGHALGRAHAPCGNPPNPDANYPAYEPYDAPNVAAARIGEYGIDTRGPGLQIRGPRTRDNMSYCGGWVSLYTYLGLMNLNLLNQSAVPIPLAEIGPVAAMAESAPFIDLHIRPDEDGGIASVGVNRVVMHPRTDGSRTDLVADLLDGNGEVLASAAVSAIDQSPCGLGGGGSCGRSATLLQASIPDVGRGAALRIRNGSDELWRREAPSKPPKVSIRRARVRKNGNLDIAWDVSSKGSSEPDIWLRWSGEEDKGWHAVTVGLTGTAAAIDRDALPGGAVRFQIMVHDGFSCATAESAFVQLPEKEPYLAMLSPTEDCLLPAGQPLRLWAALNGPGGDPLIAEGDEATWILDGDQVSMGLSAFVPPLKPGKHTVSVQAAGLISRCSFTVESAMS